MRLKEQWIREGFSNYYIVKKEQKLTYEKNILCYHTLACLLPCEFRIENGEEYYYYETGIYTNLKDRIDLIDPRLFFAYVLEVFEELESYLLDLDHLKLEPDLLFLDKEDRPVLCYLPEYEKNIFEQLREFLEECIDMISGNDKKKVRFYYEFHSFLVKEKPNMEQMKEYLDISLKVKEIKIQKEETQTPIENEFEYDDKKQPVNRKRDLKTKIGQSVCLIFCVIGVCVMIYFLLRIWKYGFYYLFLIGAFISIGMIASGVYGFFKLWKNDKNINLIVDYDQENHTVLLDDKTTLLESEDDDRTVLLMEEPIGRLSPCDSEIEEIMINENEFIIGSSIEGTDYQIEGTGISRRHIRFYKEGEKVYCEDLDSTNGVKVNGRKVKTIALREGDKIKIGLEAFIFHEE